MDMCDPDFFFNFISVEKKMEYTFLRESWVIMEPLDDSKVEFRAYIEHFVNCCVLEFVSILNFEWFLRILLVQCVLDGRPLDWNIYQLTHYNVLIGSFSSCSSLY